MRDNSRVVLKNDSENFVPTLCWVMHDRKVVLFVPSMLYGALVERYQVMHIPVIRQGRTFRSRTQRRGQLHLDRSMRIMLTCLFQRFKCFFFFSTKVVI